MRPHAAPQLGICQELSAEALPLGHGGADTAAVITAMEARAISGST